MESIQQILARLSEHGVDFVVIGGVAAILHGSARVTLDLDVCASLAEPNLSNILRALRGTNPRWRMNPKQPALEDDPAKLLGFHHLYLQTDLGILDVLSEVTGVGDFETVRDHSIVLEIGELKLRVLDLDTLMEAKRAAGRRKDLDALPELELIRQKLRERGQG
jgi:hypothetical protein